MNNGDEMSSVEKIKYIIRGWLLSFAKKLGAQKQKGPVIRNTKNIFLREIKVPVFVSVSITVLVVYFMLAMGMGLNYKTLFSVAIFTIAVVTFFVFQTYRTEKEILTDNDAVVLMCLLFIIGVLVLQISEEYFSPFIFPISAFVIMSAMLLSPKMGILYAFMLSLFAGLLNGMRFDIFLFMICGGLVVMIDVSKIRRRSDFIMTGIKVIVVNMAIVTMFYLLEQYNLAEYQHNILYAILNGAFGIILILVFMPIFEKVFSRITNIKLIELSDFNNPLLKKLMLEAPGTYHHSLMTATISEQAADAIGTNSLLARVCAYYHDIGKLKNPEYFIENQGAIPNPHDPLTPTMSSLILISHVKDGVSLAKQYNLDNEIINNIEQHHGTAKIHFFYHKALEMNRDTSEENFRYAGPKPKTKVAAIIMIADSAEAACRTIDEPTSVRIQETVEKIINNKFTDGQFSDCPITLKDLQLIRDSITASLIGIYHARIEYKYDEN